MPAFSLLNSTRNTRIFLKHNSSKITRNEMNRIACIKKWVGINEKNNLKTREYHQEPLTCRRNAKTRKQKKRNDGKSHGEQRPHPWAQFSSLQCSRSRFVAKAFTKNIERLLFSNSSGGREMRLAQCEVIIQTSWLMLSPWLWRSMLIYFPLESLVSFWGCAMQMLVRESMMRNHYHFLILT